MMQALTDTIAISKMTGLSAFGERTHSLPTRIKARLSSERVRISDGQGQTSTSYSIFIYSNDDLSTGDRVWLNISDVDFADPDDVAAKLTENKAQVIKQASMHKTPSFNLTYWKGELL